MAVKALMGTFDVVQTCVVVFLQVNRNVCFN